MEVIILALFSSVASKPSRDVFNWRYSSSFVESPWWEHYSATWPCRPFPSPSGQLRLPPHLQWPFSTLLPSIMLQEGWPWLAGASLAGVSCCSRRLACILAPAPSFPSPFTMAFCCQFLTGEFLHGWPVGKAVPNCPATQLLTGRVSVSRLRAYANNWGPFALEGGDGMTKSKIKIKKLLNAMRYLGLRPETVKGH